jgi:hypothetical protein
VNCYHTKYSNNHFSEETTIKNDGEILSLLIRGLEFTGNDFDSLSPIEELAPEQQKYLPLWDDCLCSCCIECEIPILIYDQCQETSGKLFIRLDLGAPAQNGGLDFAKLKIALEHKSHIIAGSGKSGWFEDELLEIQSQLLNDVYMKACINCLYSDYSPYGHGLFGCMMCFRNLKSEYIKVTTKQEFWSVHDRYDRMVQEIYLCSHFERRVPGIGYRG